MKQHTYSAAGVNLDAADEALSGIREAVESTYDGRVLAGIGSFGGLFDASGLPEDAVLVASTDGVGTKTMVAAAMGRFESLGVDLVNHCVNDILVQGATPLFFLDYVASSRLVPEVVSGVVRGVAAACREAGMALLGGETAEMPGVYRVGEIDLVGTIIGVVRRGEVIDGSSIRDGDGVYALASGGPQTNGFSLARAVLSGDYRSPLRADDPDGTTIGDALLVPHRSYAKAVRPLLDAGLVHGMAHITGGGIPGNLVRVLPDGLGATIQRGSWEVPEIFSLIQRRGEVSDEEMHRAFNMGAGFLVVMDDADRERAQELAGEPLVRIGTISPGQGVTLA